MEREQANQFPEAGQGLSPPRRIVHRQPARLTREAVGFSAAHAMTDHRQIL